MEDHNEICEAKLTCYQAVETCTIRIRRRQHPHLLAVAERAPGPLREGSMMSVMVLRVHRPLRTVTRRRAACLQDIWAWPAVTMAPPTRL